ncbi:MAG: threonine synthase [archaeon]
MKKKIYKLLCIDCGKEWDELVTSSNCLDCGGALDVVYDYDRILKKLNKHLIKTAPISSLKYLNFYPIEDMSKIVTLNEGNTPLYECRSVAKMLGLKHVYVKYEGANPTGAFKDRGTMVEITKALEMGKKAVCCASTGNMAASVSAFASKAGLPCYVIVPEGTPIGKLAQTLSYGAKLIQIRGTYADAVRLVINLSKRHDFYLCGDYAFRAEGQKSEAYEIVEQLDWRAPDKVIVPIGCGTNSSAIWKGFLEYKRLGFIDELPQMVGVQASGANPVVLAYNEGKDDYEIIDKPYTVASAICVGDPLDGKKILKAIYDSGGMALDVTDEEILNAQKLLARTESIFVEPSAATGLAALDKMVREKKVGADERIVIVMTGAGLKDPSSVLKVLPVTPVIDPVDSEVDRFLDKRYYQIASCNTYMDDSRVLISGVPKDVEIKKIVEEEFDVELTNTDLSNAREYIRSFIGRGKRIKRADLQMIVEKSIRKGAKKVLKVVDFSLNLEKNKPPVACIVLEYGGKVYKESCEGVGPVDALIKAFQKVLRDNGLSYALADYAVDIKTRHSDSAVDVKMTVRDEKNDISVIAMGTSPDIILASIEAFEEGCNLLLDKSSQM